MFSWLTDPQNPGAVIQATFIDTGVLIVLLAVSGLLFRILAWRRRSAREAALGAHLKQPGPFAPHLSADAEFLASLGSGGAALQTLGMRVMRASGGVRAMITLVTALMVFWLLRRDGNSAILTVMEWPMLGFCLWSLLWVFGYELRWNDEEIIETRLFLRRRRIAWGEVVGVLDDGYHSYILALRDAPKMKVLKWLRGMPEFLARLRAELDARRRN